MKVKFFGVRGSLPTPLTPQQIQNKITAVIQRISAKDLESSDSREKFISNLPSWLNGSVGGNTPCVEIKTDNNDVFVLDAGTGLRVLGKSSEIANCKHFYMFFSHFHWDHIQGLPFFDPLYNNSVKIDVYSTVENAEQNLKEQQKSPFFPVDFESVSNKFNFHTIKDSESFLVCGVQVAACKMSHPGGSTAYSFLQNGKKIVYATDVELSQDDFVFSKTRETVFNNADILIIDSQYTVEDSVKKQHWGHSAFCYAVDFAVHWNVKNLYLFHHEPDYDDKKLNSILESARWYAKFACKSELKVYLAAESQEITL